MPVPEFLELTPEKLAAIKEEQAKRRAEFEKQKHVDLVGQKLSANEERRRFGKLREVSIRAQLEAVTRDPSADPGLINILNEQLGEALAEQGRYEEAAKITPSVERRLEYVRMIGAIEKPDTEVCSCEDEIHDHLYPTPITLPRHYVSETIWSERHDKEMPVVVCSECGHTNVRPFNQNTPQGHDSGVFKG